MLEVGRPVYAFDASDDRHRLEWVLGEHELAEVRHIRGDITDQPTLSRVVTDCEISTIVHLAALQIPFCQADPATGAMVNVVGTVNVFEAARAALNRPQIIYASSAAVHAIANGGDDAADWLAFPSTLYGVYKRACEGVANVFHADHGIESVGLRPYAVYGLGRDRGLTSAPTTAILAAVFDLPYTIPFGGATELQYVEDVAGAFIEAGSAMSAEPTAVDLPARLVSIHDFVATLGDVLPGSKGAVTFDGPPLPFPTLDAFAAPTIGRGTDLTALADGIDRTAWHFRRLQASHHLSPETVNELIAPRRRG
jgi:nucleoside-diphosphate-sugar epimerase